MDWKVFATTFGLMFLAELGDKTQLATMTLTAKTGKALPVFIGAALALAVTSLLAVLVGEAFLRIVPPAIIKLVSGGLFLAMGLLILFGKF